MELRELDYVLLNKLPTNLWRHSWSQASPIYGGYMSEVEDVLHVLRDCTYARLLWDRVLQRRFVHSFYSTNLRDWLNMNLRKDLGIFLGGC